MMDASRTPGSQACSQETGLCFTLQHWCLWQSEEAPSQGCWPGGEVLPCNEGRADVSFLPLTQRRRLSPLAMAACAVAWNCQFVGGDMPTVFFSRHGESQYYFEMLEGMARGDGISPSRFSLCVHNTIAGQSSFHSVSFQPYVSLAGGTEGMFAAFLEAAGMLLDVPKVLVVCYEQPLPKAYQPFLPTSKNTWALGMVLARDGESGHSLRLERNSVSGSTTVDGGEPDLLLAIQEGRRHGHSRLERSIWHWSLDDARAT